MNKKDERVGVQDTHLQYSIMFDWALPLRPIEFTRLPISTRSVSRVVGAIGVMLLLTMGCAGGAGGCPPSMARGHDPTERI